MAGAIHHMTVIRYYRDERPWDADVIRLPPWPSVEAAIRRMDNYCFPIVQLNAVEDDESEDVFFIFGGDGRWALAQRMGDWQYERQSGKPSESFNNDESDHGLGKVHETWEDDSRRDGHDSQGDE